MKNNKKTQTVKDYLNKLYYADLTARFLGELGVFTVLLPIIFLLFKCYIATLISGSICLLLLIASLIFFLVSFKYRLDMKNRLTF